jgi:hypothetical protein
LFHIKQKLILQRKKRRRIIPSSLHFMKKHATLILLFCALLEKKTAAQNLVVNGDFESYFLCPSSPNVYKANQWFNPTQCGTPDYFHADLSGNPGCASQSFAQWGGGGYNNLWGYQIPRSGNAYGGMYPAQGAEMMAGKLSDSLRAGKTYAVSFYTVLGETYYNQGKSMDLIAIDFMTDSITDYTTTCWQYLGTLEVDVTNQPGRFLNDTLNWMLVADTFLAEGGEKYFVLANIDTLNTQFSNSNPGGGCYYYFDDFDVHCIDCTSDTSDPPVYPEITITPTLTQGELLLSGNFPSGTKFEVYDVLGQLVFYDELQSGNQNQSVFLPLGAGIYTCRVMAEGSLLKAEKVVVVK